MSGQQWAILADKALEFIVLARENHFCMDMIDIIEGRLYEESPFNIHHEEDVN